MRYIIIDNYRIEEPIINIIRQLQIVLTNGKLRDIKEGSDNIVVTCVNREHSNGHEAKPALNIYIGDDQKIEYGYARCFVCGWQGSFIKFVQECFESSEDYAKNWLTKNYGILMHEKVFIGEKINLKKQNTKKYFDKTILSQYQDWTPYLAKRHLNRAICEKFQVKYDPKNKQIIFPVFDANDNLLMMPTRSVETKIFYLTAGVEKPVYGLNVIIKNNIKSVMLVEGPIDMLSAYSHNIAAIAMLGAPADSQIEQINKSCITKLYLACDNDAAGKKFNNYIKTRLAKRILVTEIQYPVGIKDANDLSDEQWDTLINNYKLNKIF